METWQIALYVAGALVLLAYFRRRSKRMNSEE